MNIVFITNTINQIGGIERVISRLSNHFIEKLNYNVDIISVYSKKDNSYFPLNKKINIKNLGVELQQKKIKKVLNEENYDIILTFHSAISNAILFDKKGLNGKVIVTEHANYKYYGKLRHIINIINYRKADKLVVLTESDKRFYSKFIKSVEQIPNSIPFTNNKYPNYENKKIISVGRIEEVKGFDYLIDSFNLIYDQYPDWSLHIVGDGTQKQIIEERIKKYNLEGRVVIEPFTNEICNKYLDASIYALSSRFEGFSLVTIEAMECGLPIVSFDIDAPMEILKNGEDSLIVESFNINKFAEKLSLLMDNEEMRKSYGKRAKENVQKYNIYNVGLKWKNLFEDIVK